MKRKMKLILISECSGIKFTFINDLLEITLLPELYLSLILKTRNSSLKKPALMAQIVLNKKYYGINTIHFSYELFTTCNF